MSEQDGGPKPRHEPEQTGDRDPMTGRFLPGNRANPNGRPKGHIDFIAAVHKYADAEGVDLGLAAYEVSKVLLEKGKAGDVQAAKLWLDRCCGLQKGEVELNLGGQTGQGPAITEPAEFKDWLERLSQRSKN